MGYENPNVILIDSSGNTLPVQNGAAIPASTPALILAGSDGTNSRYISLDTSGRTVTVGAGTAGTPAGGVISIQGVASGTPMPVSGTVTATNPSVSTTGSAPPASATYVGASVTTAAPTYTTGQMSALSLTTAGLLRVDASATTITISGTVTSNIGTTNGLALDATLAKLTVAQSAALGSNTQAMVGGSVTTAAPTYTTGNINPLSLTTAGALRIDGSAVTQPVSGTVTANIGTTGGLALDATVAKLTVAQGASLGSNTQAMVGGSVTTAAPTYTTGQISPLSLTTAGALRIDGSAVTQPVSGTVTANQGGAPWSDNITQFGGVALSTGTGASGTGIPRVTVANDSNILATQSGTWTVTATQATAANLNAQVVGPGASGAAVSGNPVRVAGSDGANTRNIITDATGRLLVAGAASDGTAVTGNPVLVGGQDGTNVQTLLTDTTGRSVVVGAGAGGAPVGGIVSVQIPDTTATGTLNALNATVSISLASTQRAGMQLVAGTLVGTIVPEISLDGGTTWVSTFFDDPATSNKVASIVFGSSNTATTRTIVGAGGASNMRVRVSAFTSGTATCNLRSSLVNDPSVLFAGQNGSATPPTIVAVGGVNGSGNLGAIAIDSLNRQIISPTFVLSTVIGTAFGQVTTAATTLIAARATTYTEPASNAQRSVSSSSASDASAGTGARTIKLTYYTSTYTGPFTETITLNGTTAVNTVSTTICFIEKIEVVTVGSGGTNAGIISLFGAVAAGGGTVGTIAVGDGVTFWAHHYIATGANCNVTNVTTANSTQQGYQATLKYRSSAANAFETQRDWIRPFLGSSGASFQRLYEPPLVFAGPGRITLYVKQDNAVTLTMYGTFDYYEQ